MVLQNEIIDEFNNGNVKYAKWHLMNASHAQQHKQNTHNKKRKEENKNHFVHNSYI